MPTRKTAAKKNGQNGQTPLENAMTVMLQNMATLVQTQATFNQQIAQFNDQIAKTNAEIREIERANAERFSRIEQMLIKHELILKELPEAIRQKIGFQKP